MMRKENLMLIEPAVAFESEFLSLIEECQTAGEHRYDNIVDLVRENFSAYLSQLEEATRGIGLRSGYVPWTSFWMVRDAAVIVGTSSFRHRLTPALRHEGGHIGYHIRPSQRRKGYGTLILALTLEKARMLGLNRVLLTCDTDNIASARIIQKNGGELESEGISKISRKPISRYWIDLT